MRKIAARLAVRQVFVMVGKFCIESREVFYWCFS